jgi:hypothetical protein
LGVGWTAHFPDDVPLMVILTLPDAARPYLAVAVTGKVYVPAWEGAPARTPVEAKVSPAGSFAGVVVQIHEPPQDAAATHRYGWLTVPTGGVVRVRCGNKVTGGRNGFRNPAAFAVSPPLLYFKCGHPVAPGAQTADEILEKVRAVTSRMAQLLGAAEIGYDVGQTA